MKCPYCNKEMKEGFLHSTGAMASEWVFWLPKKYYHHHSFVPSTKKKIKKEDGIVIHSGGGITAKPDIIYVCEDCGKMIAEITGKSDLNSN